MAIVVQIAKWEDSRVSGLYNNEKPSLLNYDYSVPHFQDLGLKQLISFEGRFKDWRNIDFQNREGSSFKSTLIDLMQLY